ncbi:MAG: cysteine desulfurase / selenocysteine lyase [Cyanobacteriota bacterium erpe_2018_sw_21hr_WHONDRS-SW48-000092_B_bin.40]|nr:cysteine desulfurase / selenocysteine lyase [Cyanobacteriota bacterium erpe_2018_sw_21hr_WHONDRS-SW48-000092_B_bin.40]
MISKINVEQARLDTPATKERLHFNNAGAALMPESVLATVINHLQLEAKIGGYEAANQEATRLEKVYRSIAQLINCQPDEIAVVENATRAWDMAFYSMPLKVGDRILTACNEYASNYIAFLQMAKLRGVEIDVVENDQYGQIDLTRLKEKIDDKVKLIAITHVPTNGGLINPAAAVGKLAKEHKIPYLLDACQSVGQLVIDVEEIGCDLLSATGRKYLRGPRGTGFLYVRKSILEKLEPPFLDLHAAEWSSLNQYEMRPDARRFENWECNVAAKLGLGQAVDYALNLGLSNIEHQVTALAKQLRMALAALPSVSVQDLGENKCGIVTFTVAGHSALEVKTYLASKAINVAASTLSGTRIDMENRGLADLVRASVHYYNTEEEIAKFCAAVQSVDKAIDRA